MPGEEGSVKIDSPPTPLPPGLLDLSVAGIGRESCISCRFPSWLSSWHSV